MSYENCFTCDWFKSNPERCVCKDLKNLCKMEQIDYDDARKKRIVKRVKSLCDILEIDHLGLVSEGIRRLQDEYNKYVVRGHKEKAHKFVFKDPCHPCVLDIECDECKFEGSKKCPTCLQI